ncbi:CoA transferase [Thermocatellispora tengchongensis]|uniref:CoA transferase n=1 Tax=Thermocatellispora tengchongensis TaxID=1073253 RepID=UPI0036304EC6
MADPPAEPLLADLRVVEVSRGIAGAYAGRTLADCGAEVILVEPSGGHPLRRDPRTGSGDRPLFAFLSAGKKTVTGDVGALAVGADILIREWDDAPTPSPRRTCR